MPGSARISLRVIFKVFLGGAFKNQRIPGRISSSHRDCFVDFAAAIHAPPEYIRFCEATTPSSQRKIVRSQEQRTAHLHLIFVTRRINNHHTRRHQTKASREMWLCPSPYNSPVGVAQWQSKIDSWSAEKDPGKFRSVNKVGQVIARETFIYPERD